MSTPTNPLALTLWQPWATLIADGQKRFETRSWSTAYRGPILVHAGARADYEHAGILWIEGVMKTDPVDMPSRAVVAVADLTDVYRTNSLDTEALGITDLEQSVGDFGLGRYAWALENVRPLAKPVKCKGKMGLWLPEAVVLEAVAGQVGAL